MVSVDGTPRNPAPAPAGFPGWISYFPGPAAGRGTTVLFPHAGAAAVNYRLLAMALAAAADAVIVQYPQRADRWQDPAPQTLPELARQLFDAGAWHRLAPLRLFGHSMGALVAFEFARIAEERGVAVSRLWVSAGPAPASVAGSRPLPTERAALLADLAELGGTDPRLLADDEFATLLTGTLGADYAAVNRYHCSPETTVGVDIHALGGRGDTRVSAESLTGWAGHTTGRFSVSHFDGGHFYLFEHLDTLARRISADA